VDYTFADGTGYAENPVSTADANFGQVFFVVPVTSVTFGWVTGEAFSVSTSATPGSFAVVS